MPYRPPDRQLQKDKPLTDEERRLRIKEVQAEQEEKLREALGDELFEWLDAFEGDVDVLGQDWPVSCFKIR